MSMPVRSASLSDMALGALAMTVIVVASNILVSKPLGAWLTWAAFTYPVAFLVTDVMNRRFGPKAARRVIWVGFAAAALMSLALAAAPRIAAASGLAFLMSQLLDVSVFNRLRAGSWWRAPLVSSIVAGTLDSAVFWTAAFAGATGEGAFPGWPAYALADYGVKMAVTLAALAPFRILTMRATA